MSLLSVLRCLLFLEIGWRGNSHDHWNSVDPASLEWYSSFSCNIDTLDFNEGDARFLQEYYLRRPVILKGWTESQVSHLRQQLDKEQLLRDFGQLPAAVGNPFELALGGAAKKNTLTLREYVNSRLGNDTEYFFDRDHFFLQSGLASQWKTMPFLRSTGNYADSLGADGSSFHGLTFALGSSGQGIGYHWHPDSYSVQMYGRKRWAIYAPNDMTPTGFCQSESFSTWLQKRAQGKGFKRPTWECVQEEGDVLYVPEGFYHATACIGDSVGVTHLAKDYASGSIFRLYDGSMNTDLSYNDRIKLLQQAIQLDTTNAALWIQRAAVYEEGGDMGRAVAAVKKALDRNPLDTVAHKKLMSLYEAQGLERERVMHVEHAAKKLNIFVDADVYDAATEL